VLVQGSLTLPSLVAGEVGGSHCRRCLCQTFWMGKAEDSAFFAFQTPKNTPVYRCSKQPPESLGGSSCGCKEKIPDGGSVLC
jgi:hypothetical protein